MRDNYFVVVAKTSWQKESVYFQPPRGLTVMAKLDWWKKRQTFVIFSQSYRFLIFKIKLTNCTKLISGVILYLSTHTGYRILVH